MLKNLEVIHGLLAISAGVMVLMIVKRKFSQSRAEEIIKKIEEAVVLLRALLQ